MPQPRGKDKRFREDFASEYRAFGESSRGASSRAIRSAGGKSRGVAALPVRR
jgi:hypothetical protein